MGPALLLICALLVCAALVFVALRFVRPAVQAGAFPRTADGEASGNEGNAAMAEDDAASPLPDLAVGTVALADVADVQYLFDPSVYDDSILFAAGMEETALDRLVRFDTVTGEAEGVLVPMRYDTLRNPVEDDARIVYVDAKLGGGGAIRTLDKATGETGLVCELALDIPVLRYETPYLLWKERAVDGTAKLYACHLGTFDSVTLAVFDTAIGRASLPWLNAGEAIYADADAEDPARGMIRFVQLTDGDTADYAPDTFVHDPARSGGVLAWTTGNHGENNDLYCTVNGGAAKKLAAGVIDYGLASGVVAYGYEKGVYVYVCESGETVRLSGGGENAQFAAAGGNAVVWRDMANPEYPIWKYMRID